MAQATGKKVLILAAHGFEQSELEVPRDKLKAAGATVVIASPEKGEIKGWDKKDWGRAVKVDKTLDEVKADDFLDAFSAKIIEEMAEGSHSHRSAA